MTVAVNETLPGSPYPLGSDWDGEGVNFAFQAEEAQGVELCLFDSAGVEKRYRLARRSGSVWHGYVSGLTPGQRYGYRMMLDAPDAGRDVGFGRGAVLVDPYARAVDGPPRGENRESSRGPEAGDANALVVDAGFDWEGDVSPRVPWPRTVIYRADIRALTITHPEVPEAQRGTYAAVVHPAVIRHLRDLGITAIELRPFHAFASGQAGRQRDSDNGPPRGLAVGLFAPDVRYRFGHDPASEVRQVKEMVKALHRAGIELVLDVAYTFPPVGEGERPSGASLQAFSLVMDSLRYWASDMHVDGFCFLRTAQLARELRQADRLSSFFAVVHDSPVLRDLKLIGEPWENGQGDSLPATFPAQWAERNLRYRDTMRALWSGRRERGEEIGYRLTGSSDLYDNGGRRPAASVNIVALDEDERQDKGEAEGDLEGAPNEGPKAPRDGEIDRELWSRRRRNLLATLFLSQGTPLLDAGDEAGRAASKGALASEKEDDAPGLEWNWSPEQRALVDFTKLLSRLRRVHPALRRTRFFQGRPIWGGDRLDLAWFGPDGQELSAAAWQRGPVHAVGMFLAGRGIDDLDEQGRPLIDDNLLLLLNAQPGGMTFKLPELASVRGDWQIVVDTAEAREGPRPISDDTLPPTASVELPGWSLRLLRCTSRVVRTGGAVHTLGATYRLQLTKDFGFKDARATLDYLQQLGVTDLYVSPIFAAGRGSTHGYDVVDHGRLNPELGSDDDFIALTDDLKSRRMGLLVDWVPNHMGILPGQNALWQDVLENGPSSLHADLFDIDWTPARKDLLETVLVPVLGDQYGRVLERGEIKIVRNDASWFHVAYFDHTFPIGPRTLSPVLRAAAARTGLGETDEAQQELLSICSALDNLPKRGERELPARRELARETEVVKRRLRALLEEKPGAVGPAIDAVLQDLNGSPSSPATFDDLDRLLRNQAYRLASWRVASEEINYRRFFDINTLAAIKMENPAVFEKAHATLFRLLDEGKIQALRLDHTDGLYDPLAYFEKLQSHFRRDAGGNTLHPDDAVRPLPILVEKILEPGERLPPAWPVDGTTGYDFTASVEGLWVDPAAEAALSQVHTRFTGDTRSYADHVYACKQRVLAEALPSEVNMLARQLKELAASDRRWRDFTLIALTRAMRETLAAFPVYRTYIRSGEVPSEQDRRRVHSAIQAARLRTPTLDPSVLSFLEDVLLLRTEATVEELKSGLTYVALRLQQLTGAVMAKAVEDTAFYRYNRLVCLNEVGGDPGQFGTSLDQFHAANAERLQSWPLAMVATSTHDTKRGEDATARIAVLSEIPEEWQRVVSRWSRKAARYRTRVDEDFAPSRRDEYTLFQTLVGAWPFGWDGREGRDEFTARVVAHMDKAAKEAKQETSWVLPNPAYEQALREFIEGVLGDEALSDDIAAFGRRIGPYGASNALAQTLLRICAPGIPDTYQGSELWNQSLVDPDNRRPVGFAQRRTMLGEIVSRMADGDAGLAAELLARWPDGAVKLFVVQAALNLRAQLKDLFLRGDYTPLPAGRHVVSFARQLAGDQVVVVTARFPLTLTKGESPWGVAEVWGTESLTLPAGTYRDVFSGSEHGGGGVPVPLSRILRDLPLALLVSRSH